MNPTDRNQPTPVGSARTATRQQSAVRAVAAALLLLLSLLTFCATPANTSALEVDSSSALPSTTAAPAPTPSITADTTSTYRSPPARIEIAAIGVDSDVMDLGLRPDGSMEVPAGGFPAGWYSGSPTPGQLGPSIVAGHVDWGGSPGVFYRLRDLEQGNEVSITADDGSTVQFVVSAVEQYPKNAFPSDKVYGDIDHPGLRLITCGGQYDSDISSYDDNIVVYADRV